MRGLICMWVFAIIGGITVGCHLNGESPEGSVTESLLSKDQSENIAMHSSSRISLPQEAVTPWNLGLSESIPPSVRHLSLLKDQGEGVPMTYGLLDHPTAIAPVLMAH